MPRNRDKALRKPIGTMVLLAALASLIACAAEAPKPDFPSLAGTRGYVLISLDTLRADHLGSYGYERPTSPFFDRLAEERGILYEHAISQFPGTLTSHMSIFTGLYPEQHGVFARGSVLAEEIPTLPEILSAAGFRTAGFTEGGYMRGRWGFRRGFDSFIARDHETRRDMEKTFIRGRRFLDSLADEDRFFLFLHTYAPHTPYDPPQEYRSLYWPGEPPPDVFHPGGKPLEEHNRTGELLPQSTVDYFEALYDATINYLDDVLQDFFDYLEEAGLADDTTVIITSDHGEEFQEHGKMVHTGQLHHELMHVPLLVVHPDLPSGRRVSSVVESIDLLPTILTLAGIEAATQLSGRDLLSGAVLASEEPSGEGRSTVDEEHRGLYQWGGKGLFHLLRFPPAEAGGPARYELYEVLSDATEQIDRAAELEPLTRSMARHLEEEAPKLRAEPGQEPLDPELVERLRALGYLD